MSSISKLLEMEEKVMSHKKDKEHRRKAKKHYTPIEKDHCNVKRVVECIVSSIHSNWITKDEWQQIIKGVNKELCSHS
jgi:hypothetical protein